MPFRNHMLMKTKWFPQPHSLNGSVSFEADDGTIDATTVPIAFYDEGLGAPSAVETNPENANFAIVADQANCHVGSRINSIFVEFRWSITKDFIEDNINALRCFHMPIHCAFLEDYNATEELGGATTASILELQTETTDRQGGPLYVAGTDLPEKAAAAAHMGANTPFLDTDTGLEGVAFQIVAYYNAIQFQTIGPKVRACSGGLRWFTMSQQQPFKSFRFGIVPKIKAMNPFTYYGMMIGCPVAADLHQLPAIAELTAATDYIHCDFNIRYNEWNPEFNFAKI